MMNITPETVSEQIRKIEDIIDIQKANGSLKARQVAFNLPSYSDTVSANLAKSLESGLSKAKSYDLETKIIKKTRLKRHKSPTSDVISWPSDSDITVLRMKLCLTSNQLKGGVILGDGVHQPDSSSMINLATLMRQSQPPSKHSIIEEYLLPLTSWERGPHQETNNKTPILEHKTCNDATVEYSQKMDRYEPMYNGRGSGLYQNYDLNSDASTKSKLARFLRLYFCPCCRCLYKMENMSDDNSSSTGKNVR